MANNALVVNVDLDDSGLTDTGKEYFRYVINDYSNELLNRAKSNGSCPCFTEIFLYYLSL